VLTDETIVVVLQQNPQLKHDYTLRDDGWIY